MNLSFESTAEVCRPCRSFGGQRGSSAGRLRPADESSDSFVSSEARDAAHRVTRSICLPSSWRLCSKSAAD